MGAAESIAGHARGSTGQGTVLACSTDKNAERLLQIPIGRSRGDYRRAVVALGPEGEPYSCLPDLAPGDRLEISGELEVTTDDPPAIGEPYSYDPCVEAQLILGDRPDRVEEERHHAVKVAALPSKTCTHERHHTLIPFDRVSYSIPERGLPWRGDSYLNLVLGAHNDGASSGEVLLVGQNEPPTPTEPASVEGNMAKLSVLRYRGSPVPTGRRIVARECCNTHIPIVTGRRTIVYSLRLVGLEAAEQLVMRAEVHLRNPHPYLARVSAEVVVADSPSTTDPSRAIAQACAFRGQIGQFNGTNCLRDSTVVLRKYGTMRVLQPLQGHAFVNLAVTSAAPESGGVAPDPAAAIAALKGGLLEVRRFRAGDAG